MIKTITPLLERIEEAKSSSDELNDAIRKIMRKRNQLDYAGSVDDALSLLPKTAVNMVIYQFNFGWAVSYMDTAQQMGEAAATREIERMRLQFTGNFKLNAAPLLEMQKAIAQHWLEFKCRKAKTLPGAIVSAAIRGRYGIATNTEEEA